jgi:hypothetical protein
MKKILLALLFVLPSTLHAAPKPNPADYSIAVHVQASHLVLECDSHLGGSYCGPQLRINVVIDGKKLELECKKDSKDLLRLGDYKAKRLADDTDSGDPSPSYQDHERYELLFPDGKTLEFRVVGESE